MTISISPSQLLGKKAEDSDEKRVEFYISQQLDFQTPYSIGVHCAVFDQLST